MNPRRRRRRDPRRRFDPAEPDQARSEEDALATAISQREQAAAGDRAAQIEALRTYRTKWINEIKADSIGAREVLVTGPK